MQFKDNVPVVSTDGKDLGHVRRVVLDPHTDEVKDLVVRKGTLLTEDRVVPMDLVRSSDSDQVRLTIMAEAFEKLLPFEETYYVAADGEVTVTPPPAMAYYLYPPVGGFGPGLYEGTLPLEMAGYQLRRERHIPANTVALKAGATVKGRDDKDIGKVEQLLTAPGSDQATHIVVSEGMLHKTHRVVPLEWVQTIAEAEVKLAVPSRVVERLPEYEH